MSLIMGIVFWIVIALLALVNLGSGILKVSRSKEQLAANGAQMAWTEDFSQTQIRLIGVAEILGGLGLVLPRLTGILPWVSGVAAIGIAILQVGAAITHLRRGEKSWIANVVIVLLAVVVAVGVFGSL